VDRTSSATNGGKTALIVTLASILSHTLSDDPEFRARFARDARTIFTLDHPM
jgi:hypothetical protein